METKHKPYGPYEKYFKRPMDIICGLAAVIVFSWLYIILMILGAIFMRGNPFFTQERPGKDEKIFKLIKFRSMDNRKDKDGNLLCKSFEASSDYKVRNKVIVKGPAVQVPASGTTVPESPTSPTAPAETTPTEPAAPPVQEPETPVAEPEVPMEESPSIIVIAPEEPAA